MTTIAILTAVGVDFSYSTRVSLHLAENARDELRAYYLARSAVNLSRLVLHFQKQMDALGGQASQALAAMGNLVGGGPGTPGKPNGPVAGGTGSVTAGAPQPSATLGIRLWEIIPVDSNLLSSLLAGAGGNVEALGADAPRPGEAPPPPPDGQPAARPAGAPELTAPLHSFGSFDGSYHAKVSDENSRINVRGLTALMTSGVPTAVLLALRTMMSDPKYDFIFDEDDANHDRVRRDEVILAMKDWVDEDETATGLDPTNAAAPFTNAFSDENGAYDRYHPRYKAKNAPLDSLEELFMVRGVNDRFMAAFGERLTIWPDINSKININSADPQQLLLNVFIAAQNPNDPKLRDPRLLATILQELQVRKMFSFFGLSVADFVAVLQGNGIAINPYVANAQSPSNPFQSTSDTFRIVATGRVGRIEKKITTVVRYDDLLGKMIYWKED